MSSTVATSIGSALALLVTIFICAYILPAGKEGKFTGFFKVVRDYFLMRYLIVEAIVRFFFVFATTSCICSGFFLMFSRTGRYSSSSNFLTGLLTMIIGPIICRIVYELLMIAILQLRNIIEINAKMPGEVKGDIYKNPMGQPQPVQAPVQQAPVQQAPAQSQNVVPKFDPKTGEPIAQPQNVVPKFDPTTGQPLSDEQDNS